MASQTSPAQTTAFTYQGKLIDSGNPANGNYDLQFKLFDALSGGTQLGTTLTLSNVSVSNGIFTVQLDFGGACSMCFNGATRFLEIAVKPISSGIFTTLGPRQQITSSPYAVQSINALQLGGLEANRYVATDTTGKVGIDTATPSTKLEVVDPFRQVRFGPTTADNGGYLTSTAPHQAIISGGGKFDAPNWIARDTVASLTAHHFGTIEFYTNSGLSVGSSFSPNLRMKIDETGKVSIGTTDISFAKLNVDGGNGTAVRGTSTTDIGVYGISGSSIGVYGFTGNSASYAGYFDGRVIATSYVVFSDARLKQGISKLDYGLSEVLRLRPVSWLWKDRPESGAQFGLVAQEVETVLPELVSTNKSAEQLKGVNYTGLVPVLVNAIKEQQAQINTQKKEISAQLQEVAALKKLVCLDHPEAEMCKP